ncbi:MAG: hypothetical protein EOO94_03090 [Pedobacter sp.]|nr:MAG: hypothetical protein EOO94_03090 [Pedobacter sp.]
MKRLSAAIFLSLYMLSFSELPQLLKIPVFIAHFQEHKQIDQQTTVWGFIKEHYQGKFVMDEDYKRDNQLPFRTANFVLNTTVIFAPPVGIELPESVAFYKNEFNLFNDSNNPVSSLHDIFQPPRA